MSEAVEVFVRAQYVKDNSSDVEEFKGYPHIPMNRLLRAGAGSPITFTEGRGRYFSRGGGRFFEELGGRERSFVPSAPDFGEALERALECAPTLSELRQDLFVSEVVPLAHGEIASLLMDRRSKRGPEFLSAILYRDGKRCVWNHDRPASYDPARGYVVRQAWDVFDFGGRPHVLVVRYDYELLAMEVFRVDSDRLVSVSEFGFSCLGCDQ